jgi:ribosomal protein L37AE/L43A
MKDKTGVGMKKEMMVSSWTIKKKYDCPECGAKKSIKHPDYTCNKCGQEFSLKMKMDFQSMR